MKHKLQGVLPPMATPFTADEDLDLAALKANIVQWNQTGLSGYLAVGSNGEVGVPVRGRATGGDRGHGGSGGG